jgi:hypothetical protein
VPVTMSMSKLLLRIPWLASLFTGTRNQASLSLRIVWTMNIKLFSSESVLVSTSRLSQCLYPRAQCVRSRLTPVSKCFRT